MYEKEFIDSQKEKLELEKQELENSLSSFAEKSKEGGDNWNTKFPKMDESEDDDVDEVEEFTDLLPAEYALELKLKNVNEALEKIEGGNYGICEECKKYISKERLEANPSAKKCGECINR